MTFKTTQNFMKSLGHSCACINFHKKSKNVKFSSIRSLKRKRASGGKTCFVTKNSKMTKFSPNSLKFGLEVHNQVPCSAKEASAKIRSLSSLLRRFSALLVHAVQWQNHCLVHRMCRCLSWCCKVYVKYMFGLKMRNWCFFSMQNVPKGNEGQ